jgi:pyruvate/2-oxoglutarate dehydrogenase complex dihydrolipoamide dehydrogenase (E3) component
VPGILKDEQLSLPIQEGFSKYPSEAFEFIVGKAEASNLEAKTVTVSTATGERTLTYDHLVLATGTRTTTGGVPWKANGTNEEIIAMLHSTADKVKAAQHIVVAGAGATGIEVAGELGYEFKDKDIILLSADEKILGADIIAGSAENELKKLGVKIKTNARVTGHKELPGGRTEVTLHNGDTITTDLYLPTMGMLPNTEYLPETVLKEDKFVAIDEFYRAKNATNVWAAGDIVWQPRGSFVITDKQVSYTL